MTNDEYNEDVLDDPKAVEIDVDVQQHTVFVKAEKERTFNQM